MDAAWTARGKRCAFPTARPHRRPHFAHRSACEAAVAAGARSALNNHKKTFIKINEIRGWKRGATTTHATLQNLHLQVQVQQDCRERAQPAPRGSFCPSARSAVDQARSRRA